MSNATNAAFLDAISASAKVAAEDLRKDKLWPGELNRIKAQIYEWLQRVSEEAPRG